MKCINRKRRRRRRRSYGWILLLLPVLCVGAVVAFMLSNEVSVASYENGKYQRNLYTEELKIDRLCVSSVDVSLEDLETDDELHAAALFQIDNGKVTYAEKIHDRLYPASTTKILTAYLALKYGTLTDTVTISEKAVGVPLDSSRAGLKTGDMLTLETLLYGLMLPSGNDSAVAIAEHISGSEEEFVELMNKEAKMLGATNSNFVNPHGYHDKNHYTTAYDLYLIFNECVKNETFLEIVSSTQHTTNITQKNGTYRTVTWKQTNQYVNGTREVPQGVKVIGGKTGTTDEPPIFRS